MPENDNKAPTLGDSLRARLAEMRAQAKHGDVRAAVVELVDLLTAAAAAGAELAKMAPAEAAEAAIFAAASLSGGAGNGEG